VECEGDGEKNSYWNIFISNECHLKVEIKKNQLCYIKVNAEVLELRDDWIYLEFTRNLPSLLVGWLWTGYILEKLMSDENNGWFWGSKHYCEKCMSFRE